MCFVNRFVLVAVAFATFGIVAAPGQGLGQSADDCDHDSYDAIFRLTATVGDWTILEDNEVTGNPVVVDAMMYGLDGGPPATIPGPMIEVTEGDRVCVQVTNDMPHGTSVHFHGIPTPYVSNENDGVPPVAGIVIEPLGGTVAYEWTAPPAGTYLYHSHVDPDHQVMLGLYGAIVVSPEPDDDNDGWSWWRHREDDYAYKDVWMLSEWRVIKDEGGEAIGNVPAMPMEEFFPNYFTINGKAFNPADIGGDPGNSLVVLRQGEKARISLTTIGQFQHTMHMHGRNFRVVARDSVPLPFHQRQIMNTITVNPGEIIDIVFEAGRTEGDLGVWVFHCHVLHHSTNDHVYPGGMVAAVVITE